MDKERNKTGGRGKGTPNKTSKQLKSLVSTFIEENWHQVQADFDSKKLHPRDRLAFLEKLLRYVIPVMGNTNATVDIKKQLESMSDENLEKLALKLLELKNDNDDDEQETEGD